MGLNQKEGGKADYQPRDSKGSDTTPHIVTIVTDRVSAVELRVDDAEAVVAD